MMKGLKLLNCVTTGVTLGVAVEALWKLTKKISEKRAIAKEEKEANEALWRLAYCNSLGFENFIYQSESGVVPIYTYEGFEINEYLRIPEGYVMMKMYHSSGETSYALCRELKEGSIFADYHALIFLTDEWALSSRDFEDLFGSEVTPDEEKTVDLEAVTLEMVDEDKTVELDS